jgi:hypothetical protein
VSKWSSRKLAIAVGALLLATSLLVLGYVDQSVWQFAFTMTIGSYLAGQTIVDMRQ